LRGTDYSISEYSRVLAVLDREQNAALLERAAAWASDGERLLEAMRRFDLVRMN